MSTVLKFFNSPFLTKESLPFSSEITTAIASVFSVIPIAARCRKPSLALIFSFSETGNIILEPVI